MHDLQYNGGKQLHTATGLIAAYTHKSTLSSSCLLVKVHYVSVWARPNQTDIFPNRFTHVPLLRYHLPCKNAFFWKMAMRLYGERGLT